MKAKRTHLKSIEVWEIIESWRSGMPPCAAAVLDEHPELLQDQDTVLDLAHEEFCLRRKLGEALAPNTFCDQFPSVSDELRKLLDVELTLSDPDLLLDPDPDPIWPTSGSDFLQFDLRLCLGVGAAARAYLARDRNLGNRYVALKVCRLGGAEAETLGKLQHANVVPVLSVHFEKQRALTVVCMPYLGGATLQDVINLAFRDAEIPHQADVILEAARDCPLLGEFIRNEPPAPPVLLEGSYIEGIMYLAVQLADGLAYAHSQGVLHRDLKPSNVLISPQGRAMMLDFNLSDDVDLEFSRFGGTFPYMPPEQIRDTLNMDPFRSDDPRTDVFSLGAIIYQLLSGRLPYQQKLLLDRNAPGLQSMKQLLTLHDTPAEDVRKWNPDVPPELAQLIEACLQPDPAKRPASADVLADQLRKLRCFRNVEGRGMSSHTDIHSRTRHLKVGVVALALCFPIVMTGLGKRPQAAAPLPASAQSLLHEAQQLSEIADFQKASELLMRGERELGVDTTLHRAYCAMRAHDYRWAATLLDSVAQHNPGDADLLNNMGYCALKSEDIEKAIPLLDTALSIEPRHPQALLNRALCNLKLPVDEDAGVSMALTALELGGRQSHLLHYHIANLSAAASSLQPDRRDHWESLAAIHLQKAVKLGLSVRELDNERFEQFQSSFWFLAIKQQACADLSGDANFWQLHYVAPDDWPVAE